MGCFMDGINKEELFKLLKEVISEVVEAHPLSDEEVQWVRLAIQAQAQKKAFRQAVIDKTLLALISSGILWAFYQSIDLVRAHWK